LEFACLMSQNRVPASRRNVFLSESSTKPSLLSLWQEICNVNS
jgi:hypothetical protein